jgi:uncharacterized protein with NRDE domain
MCTVSFVPAGRRYIFTFNRDEQPERQTLCYITHLQLAFKDIYYAKDSKTGGTWFAADNKGTVAMLFNGAFIRHKKQTKYKKSRGIILLELIASQKVLYSFKQQDLDNTEPFSIILFEYQKLFRLTWDGNNKHIARLKTDKSHIFSSVTLYDEDVQQQRKKWMNDFLTNSATVNEEIIYGFHANYNAADKQNGLLIKREGCCSTISISQAVLQNKNLLIKHWDINTENFYQQSVIIN